MEELISACETLTMFSKRRVVVVSNSGFFKGKKNDGDKGTLEDSGESKENESSDKDSSDLGILCNYLSNVPPSTLLIFKEAEVNKRLKPYKAVKNYGRDYDFVTLDKQEIRRFIRNRMKKKGKAIRDEIVNLIYDLSGYGHANSEYNLYNLENDLIKISAHSQGEEITALDVTSTLEGDLDTFVFSLIEAMGSGRKGEALNLFSNIVSGGGKFFGILGLLIGQYELMLDVRELLDKGRSLPAIESTLKVNGYRLKKALPTIQKYSAQDLKRLMQIFCNGAKHQGRINRTKHGNGNFYWGAIVMNKQLKADLMLILVTFAWGVSYYLMDVSLADMGPFTLNSHRFLIAFLLP